MKNMNEIKLELARLVALKMAATRTRVAYRMATPPGPERGAALQGFWADCREAKENARYAQLAYALVRGRAYWTQERRTDLSNKPSAYLLSCVAGCTQDEAKAWLNALVEPLALEAFLLHERAAKEKHRAAKAERAKHRKAA